MTFRAKTFQPRGICPSCGRDVAVLADNTVARMHKTPDDGDGWPMWCDGYGRKAKPRNEES